MSVYNKIIDIQKLRAAWDRVKKNKPASGIDDVTYDQFDENIKDEVKRVNTELAEHHYTSLPVRLVNLYKGEKVRTIALYSMRDKMVQQSMASELNNLFDPLFSSQTYAYRNDKSAIVAVGEIGNKILCSEYRYFIRGDISSFFDSIRWDCLRYSLSKVISEPDVIDLIRECACSSSLDDVSGEITEKKVGIFQGSCVAPVLSNIYLMDFDRWLSEMENIYYLRYSDDFVILLDNYEQAPELMQEIKNRFEALGLTINEKKSLIGRVSDGFDFLGYHFDINGKTIPKKAEEGLYDRLEIMWLTYGDVDIEDKLKKVLEIVGGWEQYFRGEREISSIFEFAALVYSKGGDAKEKGDFLKRRPTVSNIYKDIAGYLAGYWQRTGCKQQELQEYEELWNVPQRTDENKSAFEDDKKYSELIQEYRNFLIREDYETAIEIMQSYTDMKLYTQAEFWHSKAEALQNIRDKAFEAMISIESRNDIIFKNDSAMKIMKLFAGREDMFAREELDGNGNRKTNLDMRPLTEQVIKDHLMGRITVDTYVQRPNSTVRYLVTDVDISKRVLLQYKRESEEYRTYLQRALDVSVKIQNLYRQMGLTAYVEYSGNRGYHVWLFFAEWIPTRYANMLGDIIEKKLEPDNEITIEFFPNKTRIKPGKFGQVLKIPYGIHGKTGERSHFLDEAGMPIFEVDRAADAFAKAALSDVKKVLAANSETVEKAEQMTVDDDISPFGELPTIVTEVLKKCNLMRYLCLKSVKTHYLNHFERLTVLYVFGHLGNDGQDFVHKVMSFTLNYKHQVTESFIRKMPEKPISCVKLRDQYKQLTAEIGCSCNFKRNKNCYPSPVLHAISLSSDNRSEITLPTSRTLTKEKTELVKAEMSVYTKVQEIAAKLLEVRKQRRGLDKTIDKFERELDAVFNSQGVDSMEIDMGVLNRRKGEKSTEWFIEI